MAISFTAQDLEELAADIGQNVYIDVAKWHLYLADAHLHTVLADRFAELLSAGSITNTQVAQVLASIPVQLGGGRREVPLSDLLPSQGQSALMEILEDFQRRF